MAEVKKATKSRRPPARSPEAREQQLISAALDLAEEQILAKTASSQVLSHFLRLASTREQLEKERLKNENELLKAKTEALASSKRQEALYEEAMISFRKYHGDPDEETTEIED